MLTLFALFIISTNLTSCSSENEFVETTNIPIVDAISKNYNHSTFELELLDLVNQYRVRQGLNSLEIIEHVSYVSAGHDDYMISIDEENHDNFTDRKINMQQVIGATRVG